MKKNVYTINGKRIVQGDQNILNDHEININNLSEIWYYRFPKGILQEALEGEYLEAYLIHAACLVRMESANEESPTVLYPIIEIGRSESYESMIKDVNGLLVAADVPIGAYFSSVSYRELPKFVEAEGAFVPEKLKQYRCSKEDFYKKTV